MAEFNFRYLCTPAKIYFAIAVIAAIFALLNGAGLMVIFMNLVFAFAWTFVLGWLCKKGMKTLSWFLVLLPYIIMALAMFGIYRVSHEQKQIMRTLQMQGAFGQEPMDTMMKNDKMKSDMMMMMK
jgi:predicted PurR-regulated permease PerM